MRNGDLCYLDFGMMSEAPQSARYVRPLHQHHCSRILHLPYMNKSSAAMLLDTSFGGSNTCTWACIGRAGMQLNAAHPPP